MAENKDYRHIVRVVNTDLDGKKEVVHALRKIKGVGFMFANAICVLSGIDKHKKAGYLTEADVEKLNDTIKSPLSKGLPVWMVNRQNDYETGADMHIVHTDLRFTKENDLKRMMKTKSFKGLRHHWGLPLRGQRTKSNFRRNKGKAMGVKRKK